MSQIYLKRAIAKDGNPKTYGWYFIIYKLETGIYEYHDSAAFKDGGFDFPASSNVTHWLEPVEWPTEGQINTWIEDLDFIGLERTAAEGMATWLFSRLTKA